MKELALKSVHFHTHKARCEFKHESVKEYMTKQENYNDKT